MKKVLNKSLALLMILSMLLSMLGTLSVSAEVSGLTVVASADFNNATTALGSYTGVEFKHTASMSVSEAPVIEENNNPYYGKQIKYSQGVLHSKNFQWMEFEFDNPITIGDSASENSYADISFDTKLENSDTGINFELGSSNYARNEYMYRLYRRNTLTSTSSAAVTHETDVYLTELDYQNVRIRVDLKNKTVIEIYVDDVLAADLSSSPIQLNRTDGKSTIDICRISSASPGKAGELYVDNFSVVTYISADGTSPIANKSALRKKLAEFAGMDLSGTAKATLDSAVAVALNPIATQTAVNEAITSLENINTAGITALVALADFNNATTPEGSYTGVRFKYSPNGADRGAPVIDENGNPYYGKQLKYSQTAADSSTNFQWMEFQLDTPVGIGDNASENSYAEFSADMKIENASTGIYFEFGASGYASGKHMYRLNRADALNSHNGASTTHTTNVSIDKDKYKNIRVRVDLKNECVVGIYVDDVLAVDLSSTPFPLANTTGKTIDIFRICIGNAKKVGDLYIDNFAAVTYKSVDGTSPIASKAVLRNKIAEVDEYILSSANEQILAEAVATAINPVATQAEVDAAVTALNGISAAGGAKIIAFEDFEGGAAESYADFTYATTKNPEYATIKTVTDANPV